jgi:hypothetical protein
MSLKTKLGAIALAAGAAAGVGVLAAPQASATTIGENWGCGSSVVVGNYNYWYCDGSWWNASNTARSARTIVDEYEKWNGSGDRITVVNSVSTLDGTKKVYYWYCRYSNDTTSSLLATTQVGGGVANTFTWTNGYQPCNGTSEGVVGVVHGWVGGSSAYLSTLDFNTVESNSGHQKGIQEYQ